MQKSSQMALYVFSYRMITARLKFDFTTDETIRFIVLKTANYELDGKEYCTN